MGTPIRLADLAKTYDPAIVSKLSPALSVRLGLEMLRNCAPHANYLGRFTAFGNILWDRHLPDGTDREIIHELFDADIIPLPKGFGGNDRCFEIVVVNCKRWHGAGGYEYVYRQELMITRTGELLVWDWHAVCFDYRGPTEFVVRSKIRFIRRRALKKWLSRPEIVLGMLVALKDIVQDTVVERYKRVRSMEALSRRLDEINSRIPKFA